MDRKGSFDAGQALMVGGTLPRTIRYGFERNSCWSFVLFDSLYSIWYGRTIDNGTVVRWMGGWVVLVGLKKRRATIHVADMADGMLHNVQSLAGALFS